MLPIVMLFGMQQLSTSSYTFLYLATVSKRHVSIQTNVSIFSLKFIFVQMKNKEQIKNYDAISIMCEKNQCLMGSICSHLES